MPKKKIKYELYSYGIYSNWDKSSKSLPKLIDITNNIPITTGVEFGYVIKISGAKGKTLDFVIDHPEMIDKDGNRMTPFEGTVFINSNNYDFFLGDTVWEPFDQMVGEWTLTTILESKIIAQKTLKLFIEQQKSN